MNLTSGQNATDHAEDVLDDLFGFDLRSAFVLTAVFDGDEDDPEEDEDPDEDGDEDPDEDGEDDDPSGDDIKNPKAKRAAEEAKRHRLAAKAEKKRADEAEARVREFENKDKSDLERAEQERDEFKEQAETRAVIVEDQAKRLGFFESGMAAKFKNPSRALKMLRDDLKDVEIDDEGTADVEAIKAAAEALLKSDPYLAASGDEDEGEDTTAPSGRSLNKRRKGKKDADKAALAAKYPALQGR